MSPNMAMLFPYLTSTSAPPSHRVVTATYRAVFSAEVEKGTIRPYVPLTYHSYGLLLLFAYLCVPHTTRPWLYKARWGVLAVIWWWQWKAMWEASSMSMAFGYANGLVAAWGMMWTATWLVWCRPQFDARRVERRRIQTRRMERGEIGDSGGAQNGILLASNGGISDQAGQLRPNGAATREANGNADLRERTKANGNAKSEATEHTNGHIKSDDSESSHEVGKESEEWEYYWQSYPDNFAGRFDWVMDLLVNFRGPGWSWAIPSLPPLPPSIQLGLGESPDKISASAVSSVGLRRIDTKRELINHHLPRFIAGYFLLDVFKVTMMKDPYFIFGPNTYALPAHLAKLSHFQLQMFRMFLNCSAIIVSLEMVFSFAPILGCLCVGPKLIGLRGEPFYYATTWGSFTNITDKGLAGLWGGWWHQVFRFVFAAPTSYLITNGYIEASSQVAKLTGLLFAFGISGFFHFGGSISQFPRTYPWHPPFFFALQALGILIQTTFCSYLQAQINKLPKYARQVGNFAFTFTWLAYTSWWLTDDFARGGIWLYEPIPISLLRGLGFGDKGDGWWCWEHIGIGWYKGKHWWESGIYI